MDGARASSGRRPKPPHRPDLASPGGCDRLSRALRGAVGVGLELGLTISSGGDPIGPNVAPEGVVTTAHRRPRYRCMKGIGSLSFVSPRTTGRHCGECDQTSKKRKHSLGRSGWVDRAGSTRLSDSSCHDDRVVPAVGTRAPSECEYWDRWAPRSGYCKNVGGIAQS